MNATLLSATQSTKVNKTLKQDESLMKKSLLARQACSPLIQLFFGFASDIDQTYTNRDIRDGCLFLAGTMGVKRLVKS